LGTGSDKRPTPESENWEGRCGQKDRRAQKELILAHEEKTWQKLEGKRKSRRCRKSLKEKEEP